MSKICYTPKRFGPDSLQIINQAEAICDDYVRQGYDLTLRQLYYQFVSRGLIANKDTEYKRLGNIINDARLAGEIDWNHITDRTRNLATNSHWDDPGNIIESAARGYAIDKWEGQDYRCEVWVEKEALAGVVARAARRLDVDYFSCRGYVSQSEMHEAGKRLARYTEDGQTPVIIHLGDHDPSGIDMTRDIHCRLALFSTQGWDNYYYTYDDEQEAKWAYQVDQDGCPIIVERIALNMDQITQYKPPPNPAKVTDSRATDYIKRFGHSSWELDALDPATLDRLISDAISKYLDREKFEEMKARESQEREALTTLSKRWGTVLNILNEQE